MQLACIESVTVFLSNLAVRIFGRGTLAAMLFLAPLSSALAGTLYIGGTPATTLTAPGGYYFRPWIAGSDKTTAKFSIYNKPYWATFDPNTGTLSGKAYLPNVGKYSNISITATSATSSARMASFTLVVSTSGTSGTSGTPTISGKPASTVIAVGSAFSFKPTASDPASRTLTFSVNTKPAWASFDKSTGRLYGTPGAANVGTTSNIIITANDGVASASLPAFSLSVVQGGNGSATLSWHPPTSNTNGSVLMNLAGYQIKYGTSSTNLSQTIQIANPGLTSYVVTNLTPGTYYFGIDAYNATGTQSRLSAVVSKTIN
jgi:hypothetical protein